ncbi:type II secretion system protein [Bacillus sp. 165]|uniref:type II secretion system protein n=1 Tax=Bacillus sp. 165 TaxID=1529117 RepID=UPI001AD9885E|nr:type II secretion system protein [Bacillus sp. 165]MBO9129668.1 type II secretion system protein [Bacillus sp. 165]
MRYERGYILVEMITALGILVIICCVLFPQTVYILQERKNIQFLQTATILLKEEVFSVTETTDFPVSKIRMVENKEFVFTWIRTIEETGTTACVQWQDAKNREMKRCKDVKAS